MANNRIPLQPDKYYHIYNHGNGNENIFKSDANFIYFLQQYTKHINPLTHTFAYCLMPNHFHFMVRIKHEEELMKFFKNKLASKDPKSFKSILDLNDISKLLSQQFSNFFNAYTKAFNKQHNRKGSLFLDNFNRKQVSNEEYFQKLICYIHFNPVHHQFVKCMDDWKYSSYHSLLSAKLTLLKREEVMQWFGDSENFRVFHQRKIEDKIILEMEY